MLKRRTSALLPITTISPPLNHANIPNAALETAIECMSASTPTDEQIGKLFDQHTDVSVLLNPISPTHAMTRTAAIQFAREVLTLGKSK